jgi:oligopeptidase B
VAAREEGIEYTLTEAGDVFYILTNDGDAKDFKIVEAPAANPEKQNWREVVPHKPGTLIISHMAYAASSALAGAQGRPAADHDP